MPETAADLTIDRPLVDAVIALCEEAGQAILEIYDRAADVDTTYKDDRSPLTEADLAAHRLLVAGLERLTPGVPVLSEESGEVAVAERQGWETFWLVDPLDGTKEFLKRNGEFTVNVALVRGGQPVVGVVHAPVLGASWWGAGGLGAHKQTEGGGEVALSVEDRWTNGRPDRPLTVVVSRSHLNAETEAFVGELRQAFDEVKLMPVGSSLKLCMVAEGVADIYPRLAPTMEWDTAAAQAVVEQAGGQVLRAEGGPLRYNKDDLLNPHFVVRCSEAVDTTPRTG